jgi:hypothetical protein
MANTSEEFSNRTTQDVLHLWTENRAWYKELRLSSKGLVSSRLAQLMDADDYAAARQLSKNNVAECKRRESVLMREISLRETEGFESRPFRNAP